MVRAVVHPGQSPTSAGLSDWLNFEFAARTLIHYNAHYASGALQLYANHPFIQIGPPPLALVAAVQWLPEHNAVGVGFGALMALAGVWAVRSAETTVRALLPDRPARQAATMALVAGVLAHGDLVVRVWHLASPR